MEKVKMEKVKIEKVKLEKAKMEVVSGSSMRSQNSGRRLCLRGLPENITQAWTDKNPSRQFYSCPRFKLGDECDYFSWFDEEEGTKWQRKALIEARDVIRQKTRVIEQLIKTISEIKRNLENKETVDDENEDEIVKKFEEFYV